MKLIEGIRHVVVYSAFKARHDFEVRARRIRRALPELRHLQERAAREERSVQRITERVTKVLIAHKCSRYFSYRFDRGALDIRVDRAEYRQQRRHDGIFVLEINHPALTNEEVVASYRQLTEVERAPCSSRWSSCGRSTTTAIARLRRTSSSAFWPTCWPRSWSFDSALSV